MASTLPLNPNTSQGNISLAQQAAPYTQYVLTTDYDWDNGTLGLPVAYTQGQAASNVPPASQSWTQRAKQATVQAAAPRGSKIVRFDIVRMGQPPVAPDPTPKTTNEVVDHVSVRTYAPILNADGVTYSYRVTGRYSYFLLAPFWTTDGLAEGSTPADSSSPATNVLSAANFSSSLY